VLGAAALPAAAASCTASSPSTSSSASTSPTVPSPSVGGPPTNADWKQLAASLDGTLARPGTKGYLSASHVFDPKFDSVHPQAIAMCRSVADVQRSIGFARDHETPIAARSGGHSYGGYSTGHGLVVDVTPLSRVEVDAAAGTAVVGAGARLIDLYAATAAHGVAIPGGSCPTVGIAGLALGGGQGVIGRKFGLTCDSLIAAQVVTADGSLLRCDDRHNADLYWACRGGGGGNFGIVTSFTFRTYPLNELTLFTLDWPWSAADDVLGAWQSWGPNAPDEAWSDCHLVWRSTSGPVISVNGAFVGTAAELAPLLAQLTTAVGAQPSGTFVRTMPFLEAMMVEAGCAGKSVAQCHLPTQNAAGTLARESSLARSDLYDVPLSNSAISVMVDAVAARSADPILADSNGGILIDAMGGAIDRVSPTATAFVHRSSLFLAQYFVTLPPTASHAVVSRNQKWLDGLWEALRPDVSGFAYQNYIDPALRDWQRAYYGRNLGRLTKVKQTYDPQDLFHFAQSIPTTVPN
jgi:FAD/FMN-containing dehydrogenase